MRSMVRIISLSDLPEHELKFSFSRSSGAGGQNVNKVNSKATLHWNVESTNAFPREMLNRFINKFKNHINNEGDLVISSDRFRDQPRNIADCKDRLVEMLQSVANPPKKRIATKPSRAQKDARISKKKEKSEKKRNRRKVEY